MSIFNIFRNKETEESVIKKQIRKFEKLQLKNTYIVHSSVCSVIKISSLEINIVNYINLLKGAINEINNNSISLGMYMNRQLQEVTISQFFIYNGKYIDTKLYLEEFNKVCIEFLNLYEEKNSITNKDFNTEKNLNLYSIVVNNISSLCTELSNVFEENK